jgi:hypothetical protein
VRTGGLQTWRQRSDSALIHMFMCKTVNYLFVNLHYPHSYLVFSKMHLLSNE